MQRAIAAVVLLLLASACGGQEAEQSADGSDACTADLTQVIGPEPELNGATWSPDGRRIAFSAWDGRRTSVYAVTVADCAVVRLGPRINLNIGSPDWSSANVIAFDATGPGSRDEGI